MPDLTPKVILSKGVLSKPGLGKATSSKPGLGKEALEQKGVSKKEQIPKLLKHPQLWRAAHLATQQNQIDTAISSGFVELDQHLPDQGWPQAALVELLATTSGIGELRLLAPALATLSHSQARWIAWVNPPFIPYAPALRNLGIDSQKLLLIRTNTPSNNKQQDAHNIRSSGRSNKKHSDPQQHARNNALWAMERALKSGACSCVLGWLGESKHQALRLKETQRLQIAAKQGGTLACLFRPLICSQQSSMAELRIILRGVQQGTLTLDILKRRRGWPIRDITLPLAEVTRTQFVSELSVQNQLKLWRHSNLATQSVQDEQGEQVECANRLANNQLNGQPADVPVQVTTHLSPVH